MPTAAAATGTCTTAPARPFVGRTKLGTVEAHVGNIMAKLGLPADDENHRRVQVVLTFLQHRDPGG